MNQGGSHVMFTGHSAGGAVASLLYLRGLSNCTENSPRFSCITFGAPPTVSFSVNLHQASPSKGLCLNIINEFDPVARADKAYILTVVNFIRDIYGRPSISNESSDFESLASSTESIPSLHKGFSRSELDKKTWPISPAVFCHVGPRIVLRKRLEPQGITWIQAVEVSQAEFEKLIFWGVPVHKRARYAERVESLASGHFNGASGWES